MKDIKLVEQILPGIQSKLIAQMDLGNSQDLLDILFDGAEVQASEPKVGAKKLSGLVKKASSGNSLGDLWDAPPDVSHVFK